MNIIYISAKFHNFSYVYKSEEYFSYSSQIFNMYNFIKYPWYDFIQATDQNEEYVIKNSSLQ